MEADARTKGGRNLMPLNILVEELILMAATGVSEETTEDSP
jgi:hypothetical protein